MSEIVTFTQMAERYQRQRAGRAPGPARLFETVARRLMQDMRSGVYAVGDRLPAERELAAEHKVNRAAVREALLALEVFGLIEVRVGSGAYVLSLPDDTDDPTFSVSALELMEARLLIEGEAAGLAAANIAPEQLAALDHFIALLDEPGSLPAPADRPDEAFHRMIAKATGNKAVERAVGQLWDLRAHSPDCALLRGLPPTDNAGQLRGELRAIVAALRARDPAAAKAAMRAHIARVLEALLAAIEEQALEQARALVADSRRRFSSVIGGWARGGLAVAQGGD